MKGFTKLLFLRFFSLGKYLLHCIYSVFLMFLFFFNAISTPLLPRRLGHVKMVFSLKLFEIFPAYVRVSRTERGPFRLDLALHRFSISLPTLSLHLCLSPPPLFLSLFSPSSFTPYSLYRLSRPVRRDDWRIDSSRVVQSGLRHRVCVFQKCWRRLSRRSSSPPRPPSSSPFTPWSPRRSPRPPSLSPPSWRVSSSSQNQWVECSRSSAWESAATKVRRVCQESRDRRTIPRVFDPSVTRHTRHITDLASLIYPTWPLNFGHWNSVEFGRRTSRRHVESLSIVTPCW